MLKKSKLMSLVLALCIIISAVLPLSASAAISFSDVPSDHTYYDAITNLAAEGIINGMGDGKYEPNQAVTRAQFTKIICYATYVGDVTHGEGARTTFSDVAPDHWAINNIITAKNAKIINGYDDGTFKPDQTVLYEQAVKMAACAIGYSEERAKREGGYPDAYLKFALKQGILEGVDGKVGEPLNRDKVAQLIDKMRDADRIDPLTGEIIGSLREENVNNSYVDGRIVAINTIALYHDEVATTSCKNNQIEVELANGTRDFYWIDTLTVEDPYDYLGRTVTVYYEKDASGENNATEIVFKNGKNKEYDIEIDDINMSSSGPYVLSYYDKDENEQKIDVESNISVIHNGQAVNMSFSDVLTTVNGKSGTIKLVCTQSEEAADVVMITTYEIYYVTSLNRNTYTITDSKRQPTETVDLNESVGGKEVTYIKNGKEVTFSAISQYNVISVSKSPDGKQYNVIISDKKASGTVVSTMGNKFKLSGSDTYYEFAATTYGKSGATAGNNVSLVLDAFGKVVITTVSASAKLEYGYLSAAAKNGSMGEETVQVRIYKPKSSNSAATGEVYTLSDKVKIDGSTKQSADEILTYLETVATGMNASFETKDADGNPVTKTPANARYSQPIQFSAQGKVINSIITDAFVDKGDITMDVKKHNGTGGELECLTERTVLGGYSLSGSTKIIVIPLDRSEETGYLTKSNSYFTEGEKYYVQVVNPSTTKVAEAVYVYGIKSSEDANVSTLGKDDAPMIVKGVTEDSYYEGQNTTKLELIKADGTSLTVYKGDYANTEGVDTAKIGDIVRVVADSKNYVSVFESVVSEATMDTLSAANGFSKDDKGNDVKSMNTDYRVVAGVVKVKDGNELRIAYNVESSTIEETINIASVKLYTVGVKAADQTADIREAMSDEIGGSSKVFIYAANNAIKYIVIYN